MTDDSTTRTTRAQRLAMPLARDVVADLAIQHGACIRPVQLRRTNLDTGDVEQVLVPCGHTSCGHHVDRDPGQEQGGGVQVAKIMQAGVR